MRFLLALFTILFSLNSYANFSLPNYGEENLVSNKAEKELLFEAIKFELENQGLNACTSKSKWNLVTYVLAGKGDTDLYKLEGVSPLFVIRVKNVNIGKIDVVDFKIYTNPEMTEILNVVHYDYSLEVKRVNVGTLAKPKFVTKEVVKVELEADCYNN